MKEHDYGPGDFQTWPPCTNHPLDPRTEDEPDDDFLDKSDPRETDEIYILGRYFNDLL